jgi:hypothetical protein
MSRYDAVLASAALAVLASCSSSGGGGDASASTTTTMVEATTTGALETTTTEAEVDGEEAGEEFQALVEKMAIDIDDEAEARDEVAEENDLDTALEGIAGLQDVFEEFDGELSDLEVPEEAQDAVDDVLESNEAYIDALDAFDGVTDVSVYNDLLEVERQADDEWKAAVNSAADELGVDGVEVDAPESSGDVSETEDPDDDDVDTGASDVAANSSFSMDVPEGFTSTDPTAIVLDGPDGARVSAYSVNGDSGLAEAAAAYATGNVERSGWGLAGGPVDAEIGGEPAIAYFYDFKDGNAGVDVFFQIVTPTGPEFHTIRTEALAEDLEEISTTVSAVYPTVEPV